MNHHSHRPTWAGARPGAALALLLVLLLASLTLPGQSSASDHRDTRAPLGAVVAWGDNGAGQTNVPAGLGGVIQVAAGSYHTVALKVDGSLVAWGDNGAGQTNVPAGLGGVIQIAAGSYHTVALKADGSVIAWGDNGAGQTNVPAGLGGVIQVAAGSYHTVALKADGSVIAWGHNGAGQTNVPAGLGGVVQVAAGSYHTVALKADGSLVAWGDNGAGQTSVPAGLGGVIQVAAGSYHTVALKADGSVIAWGDNGAGQTNVPAGLGGVIQVAAGSYHTVALKADGSLVAWGHNGAGQTNVPAGLGGVVQVAAGGYYTVAVVAADGTMAWGRNNDGQTNVPASLSGVIQIAAGDSHTVALKSNGSVVAWGKDNSVPAGLSGVAQVAAGSAHTVALKADGAVVAWGDNSAGQMNVPASLSGVIQVAAGESHTVALKADGTVVAWGSNRYGQTNVPASLSGVAQVAAGDHHTIALKADGSVVAWGRNDHSQTNVPANLGGVIQIAAGESHTVALKADGTVVAWGSNEYGQTNVPAGLSGVVQVAAGDRHTVALKADGTVIAWGSNKYGQTNVPAGLSGVVQVAAGGFHTIALAAPVKPAFTSGPPPGGRYGQAYSFHFTASGLPAPAFSVTAGALPPGLRLDPHGELAGTPTQAGSFGPITITAGNGWDTATQQVALSIAQAPLTLTADHKSRAYGAANPPLTVSASGLVNNDDAASVLTGSPATAAGTTSPVGAYPITRGTLAANSNYALTFTAGTLTVTPATLMVTADHKSRAYGAANPPLTVSVSGLVNNDSVAAILTGTPATNAGATSPVGAYPITRGTLAANSNYALTFTAGTLAVTPAPLAAIANDVTRKVGTPNPPLTVRYSSFANGENAGVLDTPPIATTAADISSPIGVYPILVSGGADNNYQFIYIPGTLTITAKDVPTLIWAPPAAITYGTPLGAAQLNAAASFGGSSVAGAFVYDPPAGSAIGAGSHTLRVSFTPADPGRYAAVQATVTLTINPAPLIVIADDHLMQLGAAMPALTYTVAGLVNGDSVANALTGALATTATPNSLAGSYPITRGTLAAANYAISFTPGELTIQPPQYTFYLPLVAAKAP